MVRIILAIFATGLFIGFGAIPATGISSRPQWESIVDGIGVGSIVIDRSTRSDVIGEYGRSFELTKHNSYSGEMFFSSRGASFYYCLHDPAAKIFLIEMRQGVTTKGVVIGQSTLSDVYRFYGKETDTGQCDSTSCVYEYEGIQFTLEGEMGDNSEEDDARLQWKVTEADITSPTMRSNFCDNYEPNSRSFRELGATDQPC